MLGNQALQRLLAGGPHGRQEQEADRTADRVLRPGPAGPDTEPAATPAGAQAGGGLSLSAETRSWFEPRLGHDLGPVRLHADARAATMAQALHAEAFTIGSDIYFGAGRLPRGDAAGARLLAHELAHVVQQSRSGPAIQPKLKISGSDDNLRRTMSLLNAATGGYYHVSIDDAGQVKIEPVRAAHTSSATGPSATQKALADRLWKVTTHAREVAMTVSASSATVGGSYATADFDIADLEVYGVGGLIHEIEEQYQKQVHGKRFGTETTGAHAEAIEAESEVVGAKRGAQRTISSTTNADGTVDAVVEIRHTFPDGTVRTKVLTIVHNDIVRVAWK